jgi:transketolase
VTSMRERFAITATNLLDEDERVVIVLAEISTQHLEAAIVKHPDRVVNVGIMEQAMVSVAAGLALEGFRPIVHTIAPFLVERPYEQLKLDFGYQGIGGTFVSAGASYDYASEGGTHHAGGDVQAMRSIPRMRVLVPGHADEVDRLLRAVYADGQPTYIRTSTAQNISALPVTPGRVEVVRRGSEATLIAVGPMLTRTLSAVEGSDVSVLYVTTLEPFDRTTIRPLIDDGSTVVVVEPYYEGTTAGALMPVLDDRAVRLASIGVPRQFIRNYGESEQHDVAFGLDLAGIRRRVGAILRSPYSGERSGAPA